MTDCPMPGANHSLFPLAKEERISSPDEAWGHQPPVCHLGLTKPVSFSSPQPSHLTCQAPPQAAHAGTSTPPLPTLSPTPPGPPALPHSTGCPSPISVALDRDGTAGAPRDPRRLSPGPFPSSSRRCLGRFLWRGCWTSPTLAVLSPRCPAVPHGKVQPLGEQERRLRPDAKVVSSFFQVRMDAPSESRVCPAGSEEGEHRHPRARKDSAKELICPWETPMEEGRAG
ncbi:regulator of G-protein signaling 9-like [Pithys albifrons albifrons]|uniref:regulator of G-protein signaling 9-like n=1 Tax=Pithys albifrons albifrons TaxID=3385563 RepID=UPI003A5CB7C9